MQQIEQCPQCKNEYETEIIEMGETLICRLCDCIYHYCKPENVVIGFSSYLFCLDCKNEKERKDRLVAKSFNIANLVSNLKIK